MTNSSATGGYLSPTPAQPGELTLEQFIQTVFVGVSAYPGSLVRPKWQQAPPNQPDVNVNWIAYKIAQLNPDTNAFVGMDEDEQTQLKRQQDLPIQVAFYGPDSLENIQVFLDGFQIQQNLRALQLANMGYRGFTPPIRGPDLVNERWVDRWEMTLTLTRQVQRTYPIVSFASARGSIHTEYGGETHIQNWQVTSEET